MKKKVISLLVSTAMISTLLVGCGSNNKTANTNTNVDVTVEDTADDAADNTEVADSGLTTDEITLKVWESTGGSDEFIQQAGEKFTEMYPNITIEFENVELGDSTTQIGLDGPAGVGADVFAAPHDKLGELVAGGHVLPTEDAATVGDSVLGACASALTYDGTMYGYPVSAETYALYYNKALIDESEVPTTWEGLKEWATTFNAENPGKYGFLMDVGNGYYTIIFTTSEDNRLFGPEGTDAENTNINSEASVDGMNFFKSLREVLDVPASDIDTATDDGAFGAGEVALYISGPWNIATFEEAGIDFGVAPLPSLPGNSTPSASFSGTRAMFVSAYTDYPAEASAFADFLISPEMQQLRYEITGALPSIDVAVDSPYAQGFLTQLDYAFPMPSIPSMSYFWDAMNNSSANIWNGADVQAELDEADAAMRQ